MSPRADPQDALLTFQRQWIPAQDRALTDSLRQRVLGDAMLVRRMAHTGFRRGIHLPETSQEAYSDCCVIQAGPGIGKGMHAQTGDRILCAPEDFEGCGEEQGWVSDRRLLAVIRAPDYSAVEPAADWLLVAPDRRADLVESEGGVLVARWTLAGDEARVKERAYERALEYHRLRTSRDYLEEPTDFDRAKRESVFLEMIPQGDEWDAFMGALQDQRERFEREGRRPGFHLAECDYKALSPMRLPDRLRSGVVLGIGPDVRETGIELGARYCWDYFAPLVRLTVAGVLQVLVRGSQVLGEIDAAADVEWRRAW